VSFRGRWYVVGHDVDRQEPRIFRLSRVQGDVVAEGQPDSFEVPAGTDVRAVTASLAPPAADRTAEVLVRRGAGHGLRRHAAPAPEEPTSSDLPAGWDRLLASYGAQDAFTDEVLSYGADVVVVSPQEVRDAVVRRLREITQAQEATL
jgi:proteasome accessory factor B